MLSDRRLFAALVSFSLCPPVAQLAEDTLVCEAAKGLHEAPGKEEGLWSGVGS